MTESYFLVLSFVEYGSANVLGNFLSKLGAETKDHQNREGIPPGIEFYNGACGDNLEFTG